MLYNGKSSLLLILIRATRDYVVQICFLLIKNFSNGEKTLS